MKYKAAVFDLDGTILDTLEDLHEALNVSLRTYGFPERTTEETRRFVGNGIRRLVELGVPAGTPEEQIGSVFDTFNLYYAEHCRDHTGPYEGISDLITKVRACGLQTAVVSNKSDYAVQDLCSFYFPGLFDFALGVTERIRKKPAPDMVEEALLKMHVNKEDAVYIGDSEVDLMTAENTGMECITVLWGFRSEDQLTNAKIFVKNTEQLFAEITK